MRQVSIVTAMAALIVSVTVAWRVVGAEESAHWEYKGITGAANWAKEFPACGGRSQSPIDIRTATVAPGHPIQFHYADSRLRVINNGHTVMVNYDPGSFITLDGAQYQLLQFHFHRPSEERIHGRAYAFVAHLVHQSSDGRLAVVAVLFQQGTGNPLIDTIWHHFPNTVGQEVTVSDAKINAAQLLPDSHLYYRYSGSLTTPPCTEGVKWNIMAAPLTLSAQQLATFPFKNNARPLQPLNGRSIEED